MKVLVTGGAGFIGSHLADYLINKGHDVVVVDDLSGGFEENFNEKAVLNITGSITDNPVKLAELFECFKFDYVYHLAAYAAEGLSHFIKRFNYENNLIGSVNLINESIKNNVKRFVYTSSAAVYGSGVCIEMAVPEPEDSYGIAKLAVERELEISQRMFGLDYTIFRPHNVYGPRQNIGDKYRNVVGIFMNQILKGEPLTIFGDGSQTREFTYIDDIIDIIAESAGDEGMKNEVYNIGSSSEASILELTCRVASVMESTPDVKYLPERNEVKNIRCSHEKINAYHGGFKHTDLQAGLEKMAEWVKQHGARESQEFKNIEVTKNLPESWNLTK
jgi:UDP-glucose 4-epimerase